MSAFDCSKKKMMTELEVLTEELRLYNLSLDKFNEAYKDQIHFKLQIICNFNRKFECPCGCLNDSVLN
jgi:hypothetical protein